jgi:hypothetical protein
MRILPPAMNGFLDSLAAFFGTPPDDEPPCVEQSNSFREVVSLQAVFVTLTVALVIAVSLLYWSRQLPGQ